MPQPFHSFVLFAEMRTGSNFLESNLNALSGVVCHGEAFNPNFIGYPKTEKLLGLTLEDREQAPLHLLERVRQQDGVLAGFRYFHDHDPRVLDPILDDRGVAKIILTRNPIESYVSLKIAAETGQWKLTNIQRRKEVQAEFDGAEFLEHVDRMRDFQAVLMRRLQVSGQTAFYVNYEDLNDLDVMNGLARFLGVDARLEALDNKLKRQNPASIEEKISNPEAMHDAVRRIDWFDLARTPNFEPRRGPAVPSYIAAPGVPLLYMPIKGSVDAVVSGWLATLGAKNGEPSLSMSQKELRQWRRSHAGHRSFTVVCHPLERAHAVFCQRILTKGPDCYRQIRNQLRRRHGVDIPEAQVDQAYSRETHRVAFEQFLTFLKMNLAGQTSIRVDATWASQCQIVSGFAELAAPDVIIRREDMTTALPTLARDVGVLDAMSGPMTEPSQPFALADIYDEALDEICRKVYQRDYLCFGYELWSPKRG